MRRLLRWAVQKEIPHATFIAFYFSVIMWMIFEDFYAVKLYFAISVLLYILSAAVFTIYSLVKGYVKRKLKERREKERERKWREWVRTSWKYYLR